ncbi:uncharacterized protein LOC134814630 [Bolinopsis microptera]|uniref:uncharacterized protein LOC134814630 n=1 Tax=Bolinopsis microptera TaxID=2820187 RepID=UPI00307A5DAF
MIIRTTPTTISTTTMILRTIFLTTILFKAARCSTRSHQIDLGDEYSDLEDLHRSLSETLSEMQSTLYEIKNSDHSTIINQMNSEVRSLTIKVNDLQSAKESLESKVSSLEAEMDCVMGRRESCSPSTCMNGGSLISEGECLCRQGFTGDHCETDVNECESSSPCLNGGRCKNTYGSYKCNCPIDYYGARCEQLHDDCSPNPCGNGLCFSPGRRAEGVPHFQCICNAGWEFPEDDYSCSKDINECEEIHLYCDEMATDCDNTQGSYECTCPSGYFGSGKMREGGCIEIADCSSDPCYNGQCVDLNIGYTCECEEGWTGPTCGTRATGWCSKQPCRNGARCEEHQGLSTGPYRCHCMPGFKGQYCEEEAVCDRVTCLNGGTCDSGDGRTYTCQCRDGFAGTHCEGLAEACEGHVCQNGADCLPTNNEQGYRCKCMESFEGQFCEDQILYELTTCGVQGPTGPDDEACSSHYGITLSQQLQVNVVSGIQSVFIAESGVYQITARGASGGSSWGFNQLGGYPAIIRGNFRLGPGFIKVAVGQQGECYKFNDLNGKKSKSVVCGGGGGTFVVSDNEPLLIAGGGGGAGDNGPGINASKTIEGTYHMPNSNVFGGRLGDGGKSCPNFGGAGGAGFVTNGEDGFSSGQQIQGTGGRSWPDLRGGEGTDAANIHNHGRSAFGGFGGGGRGTWCPGGGGGYSGGAGKCSRTGKGTAHKGGGGGGSLVHSDAISRDITIANIPGPGEVKIVRLSEQ